jgi:copper chaperone CopZ
VYSVFVDLGEGSAEVDFDAAAVTPDALVDAVKSAGYDAVPAS